MADFGGNLGPAASEKMGLDMRRIDMHADAGQGIDKHAGAYHLAVNEDAIAVKNDQFGIEGNQLRTSDVCRPDPIAQLAPYGQPGDAIFKHACCRLPARAATSGRLRRTGFRLPVRFEAFGEFVDQGSHDFLLGFPGAGAGRNCPCMN